MADDRDLTRFEALYPEMTEERLRDDWNTWANEGQDPDEPGPDWTDTREGNFFHVCTQGGVRDSARWYDLAGTEVPAAASPLWAWGEYLDDHAEVQTVDRLPATFAEAMERFTGDDGTVIDPGTRVAVEPATVDADPLEYEVVGGGVLAEDPDNPGTFILDVLVRAVEGGSAWNVSEEAITAPSTPLPADITSLVNTTAAVGGTDPETDEALRSRLLDAYEGRGPGTVRDYRAWARSYGGVGRVTVIPLWNGPGTVLVIVTDPAGDPVSNTTVEGLQAFLDPVAGMAEGEAPVGASVTVQTADALAIVYSATVEFEPGYSLDGDGGTVALRDSIDAAVDDYVENVEPGSEVVLAQADARVISIFGVHDIGGSELNGVAGNVAVPADPPQVPSLTLPTDLTEGDV